MSNDEEKFANVARGVRLDLAIAVCALLISTLAASASWWQARVLQGQTQVLQEQLGAQVWPYISVTEGFKDEGVRISVANDGLGPAILRSMSASVDGRPESSFVAILHAILGPNLVQRAPRGDRIGIGIDSGSPGTVVRPGDQSLGFSLRSRHYSGAFTRGLRRLSFRVCYCAIVPGKCWLSDSASGGDPRPQAACPVVAGDLLHQPAFSEITSRNF